MYIFGNTNYSAEIVKNIHQHQHNCGLLLRTFGLVQDTVPLRHYGAKADGYATFHKNDKMVDESIV